MKTLLFLDLETFNVANLPQVGLRNYVNHPSLEVSLFSFAMDQRPAVLLEGDEVPEDMVKWLTDSDYVKVAWNSEFDRQVLEKVMDTPLDPDQWIDAMALAASCSLPLSLDKCGEALGLPTDQRKQRDGSRLIRLFSMPNAKGKRNDITSHPDDWVKWRSYAVQDTNTMRVIYNRLSPYLRYTMPPTEQQVLRMDQRINNVGVPVDLEHCRNVIDLNLTWQRRQFDRSRAMGVDNPNSPKQVIAWCAERGVKVPDCKAHTLDQLLENKKVVGPVADMLRIRLDVSRSSVAKFQKILNLADGQTGRLYDTLQYYAGHTGRWGGRGAQLQNLPHGVLHGDTVEEILAELENGLLPLIAMGDGEMLEAMYGNVGKALASTVRATVVAPEGKQLVVADYASIETAVIAWLAGCKRLLQVFADGGDPYKDFAAKLFNKDVSVITKSARNYAKPALLGCVFGLGANGYREYAKVFGQEVSQSEAERIVTTFRNTYPEIPELWKSLRAGVFKVMRGDPSATGKVGAHLCWHKADNDFLMLQLPSGRSLAYPYPKIVQRQAPWGDMIDTLQYRTVKEKQWVDTWTHPGKLAENCLSAGTEVLTRRGWVPIETVRLSDHVHDGVEWVVHEGLIDKGEQDCINYHGVWLTPEHEVLNEFQEWQAASEFPRPHRPEAQSARRDESTEQEDWHPALHPAVPMESRTVYDIRNAGPRSRFVVRSDEGPIVVHNCTQAVARDLLATGLQQAEAAGFEIILHVHDEIVALADKEDPVYTLDNLIQVMTAKPKWAEGLPIGADGFVTSRYLKL